MSRFLHLILLVCIIAISGCRKNLAEIEATQSSTANSFSQIFDAFWIGMKRNYVFWDVDAKKVDWDKTYSKYKQLFSALDIKKEEDVLKGVSYIREMTKDFSDGHLNITFNDSRLQGYSINPSAARRLAYSSDPVISRAQLLNRNPDMYLDAQYYKGIGDISTVAGSINGEILYFYFDYFGLKSALGSFFEDDVKKTISYFIGSLKSNSFKKLIIDLRGNVGGDVSDLNFLVGQMTKKNLVFGKLRYKNGYHQLDYSPWLDAVVYPQENSIDFTKPIIVLVDRRSASMAEITTVALKAFPYTTVIGDTTFGATGIVPDNYNTALYNSGPFIASDFIRVYTAAAEFITKEGRNYEGLGIPPDLVVRHTNNTRDLQLEAAIKLANSHTKISK